MAILSAEALKCLAAGLGNQTVAQEVALKINRADAHLTQSPIMVVAAIVATAVSQTTDFGALEVGDKVLMIPATAGNADLITVATLGTLGQAAVVGNIYLVLRAFDAPDAADTVAEF